MTDIRLYLITGYDKESDDRVTELMSDLEPEMDMGYIRAHKYSDEQRKKLNDLDTLAKQMVGQRFGFFCDSGTVLSGKVTGFSWDEHKVVIHLHLQLDVEPDANIGYSANVHSGLSMHGDTVIITDKATPLPFDPEGIPANTLKVTL